MLLPLEFLHEKNMIIAVHSSAYMPNIYLRTTQYETRLHKSRSSRDELEFDLSNFV